MWTISEVQNDAFQRKRNCVSQNGEITTLSWDADIQRQNEMAGQAMFPKGLTVEGGEVTPTFKVRGATVANRYEIVIANTFRQR